MSTKGVVDIVFCIDASESMKPCIDSVRQHVVDFIRGLESNPQQQKLDWRIDFLAHSGGSEGGPIPLVSVRKANMDLVNALYHPLDPQSFFTSNLAEFQRALDAVQVRGDEATLVALDVALDFPWRPKSQCHRVIICLTDEPLETGTLVAEQMDKIPALIEKIQELGLMLFLVAPRSTGYSQLSEVDRSEYRQVSQSNDGLKSVNFAEVLSYIGKSVSVSTLQSGDDDRVQRGLFGQAQWTASDAEIRGR